MTIMDICKITIVLLCVMIIGCTQTEYVKFYPLHEKVFPPGNEVKLIKKFDASLLNNNHSVIGYVTAEQVLRKCPRKYDPCKSYPPEVPLISIIEKYASEQGGDFITHVEKRYLNWVGTKKRCTAWTNIVVGKGKNGEDIMGAHCVTWVKYKVDYYTVVLHGLVWRHDNSFNTTRLQQMNQISAWNNIVNKYENNCLIVSPSAQGEYNFNEVEKKIQKVFVAVNRAIMNKPGMITIEKTMFKYIFNDIYNEIGKSLPEIPCEIQHAPFMNLARKTSGSHAPRGNPY